MFYSLAKAVYEGTPQLPPAAEQYAQFIKVNTSTVAFKQVI